MVGCGVLRSESGDDSSTTGLSSGLLMSPVSSMAWAQDLRGGAWHSSLSALDVSDASSTSKRPDALRGDVSGLGPLVSPCAMVHLASAAEFSMVCLLSVDGGGGLVAREGAEDLLSTSTVWGLLDFNAEGGSLLSNSMVVAPAAKVTFWGEADGLLFLEDDKQDFNRGGCISGERGAKSASSARASARRRAATAWASSAGGVPAGSNASPSSSAWPG